MVQIWINKHGQWFNRYGKNAEKLLTKDWNAYKLRTRKNAIIRSRNKTNAGVDPNDPVWLSNNQEWYSDPDFYGNNKMNKKWLFHQQSQNSNLDMTFVQVNEKETEIHLRIPKIHSNDFGNQLKLKQNVEDIFNLINDKIVRFKSINPQSQLQQFDYQK